MKKLITLLLVIFSILTMGITSVAAELPTTLVVHYYRYDQNYSGYDFWMWESSPSSLGGVEHDFDPLQIGDYGVYYNINLTEDYPTATQLGIIIRKGSWDGYREPGGDRFIDLNTIEVIDGTAHAYFVEGDIRFGTSEADLDNNIPDYRDKILTAAFNANEQIVLRTTSIINNNDDNNNHDYSS